MTHPRGSFLCLLPSPGWLHGHSIGHAPFEAGMPFAHSCYKLQQVCTCWHLRLLWLSAQLEVDTCPFRHIQ